jgi:hypothetical protein
MFNAYYEEWQASSSSKECSGYYASSTSAAVASGDTLSIYSNSTYGSYYSTYYYCAYDVYFEYMSGLQSDGVTVVNATTQFVTIYTDEAVVSAASAFALTGIAVMFL